MTSDPHDSLSEEQWHDEWDEECEEYTVWAGPDLKYWSNRPTWTIAQAVALSCRFHPGWAQSTQGRPMCMLDPSFANRLESARRSVRTGELTDPVDPMEFIKWAEGERFSFPHRLKGMVKRATHRSAQEHLLGKTEQQSIAMLIVGMASAKWNYKPDAARNEATRTIAKALDDLGMSMNEDTVRKWLRWADQVLEGSSKRADGSADESLD